MAIESMHQVGYTIHGFWVNGRSRIQAVIRSKTSVRIFHTDT